ncbi:N-acetylmuramoyl-L-alanine amidase [Pelagibacteraceae bacterium]|jgi:N-acetylmuramoyl-L-alanine amidase|nr:N-acetylmuramoyl-L-alanine amidase [Pelagibacteraceae bacterium]MDC1159024.1 N-acetylmuramoyl-L-alanine amidase [Pelagibacteraceae bacterium]
MKIFTELSRNYSKKIRTKKNIKFIIIHYTGMQSEIESFKRLKDENSKVSSHYFINRKGKITQMINDNNIAWHAGKSKWKNFKNLNENSIGIELVNKGHEFGYQKFTNLQIKSLIYLCKKLKKKYKIKTANFLGHSDIAPLRKSDPGEKFPWEELSRHRLGIWQNFKRKFFYNEVNKKRLEISFFKNLFKIGYRYFSIGKRCKTDKLIIKSFQQHYLPHNVTGKLDQKTAKIANFLSNKI